MSSGLRVLAVDDEAAALQDLVRLLEQSPLVAEVDCAHDGAQAITRASTRRFDAIFLDVRMPSLDGLQLARVIQRFAEPPAVVFVSAHEEAAVDAFELRALDYVLKPVGRRRLEETLDRLAERLTEPNPPPSETGEPAAGEDGLVAVSAASGGAIRLLHRSDILYLQSHGDFARVVTPEGRYLLRETLTELERRWSAHGFVRVHRQYLANLARAAELRPQLGGTAVLAFAAGHTIPVARRHAAELSRRLRP